jgi:hypothetical protein
LDPQAVSSRRCFTGRGFAYEDGRYDIVTDDILFSAPEEHQDTTAVLEALDLFTACRVHTRELSADAVITLSDSLVEHATIYWPEGEGPSYDRMLAMLTDMFGEPFQNPWGVRYWSADSLSIYLNKRSIFGPGTAITLGDARLCARYEELVHRNNSRDRRSYPCWKQPERLDPEEVFTERPVSLADSDLVVAGVAYGADSAQVRRALGAPAATDSAWTYPGLRLLFQGGRVHQIVLTTPQRATARGLRVGDRVVRAKQLYGTPCILEIWAYCRTVTMEPDPRAMILEVKDRVITEIRVGAIFAQDPGH